ncbi:MAG TPA: hypothetical protein VFS43_01595 [Polyangiaceae bacterium]|nr:hypothetical protein [Polyangiaceae bacterium]
MRPPRKPKRYEPPHSAYLLMLRQYGAWSTPEPGPPPPPAAPNGARLALSLRALLSARGLSLESCRLTLKGVDDEGLVIVDVESEGRSLSLRLRPGGYEVVRGVEASVPPP